MAVGERGAGVQAYLDKHKITKLFEASRDGSEVEEGVEHILKSNRGRYVAVIILFFCFV